MKFPTIDTFSALADFQKSAMAMLTLYVLLPFISSKLPVETATLLYNGIAISSLLMVIRRMSVLGPKWWLRFVFVRRGARIVLFVTHRLKKAKAANSSRAITVKVPSLRSDLDRMSQTTASTKPSQFTRSDAEGHATAAQMNFIRFSILSAK